MISRMTVFCFCITPQPWKTVRAFAVSLPLLGCSYQRSCSEGRPVQLISFAEQDGAPGGAWGDEEEQLTKLGFRSFGLRLGRAISEVSLGL